LADITGATTEPSGLVTNRAAAANGDNIPDYYTPKLARW
jgi:hypothetical protein